MSFFAACIQLQCNSDVARNWAVTERLVREAAAAGAKLIVTPENTTFLGPHHQKVALCRIATEPER